MRSVDAAMNPEHQGNRQQVRKWSETHRQTADHEEAGRWRDEMGGVSGM